MVRAARPPQRPWSRVIDALLRFDPYDRAYTLHVINGDGSEVGPFDIEAVTARGAQIEATLWLKGEGWVESSTRATWVTDEDGSISKQFKRVTL